MSTASVVQPLEERVAAYFASDPEAMADPYPLFRELREAGPVHQFGPRVLVTGYADAKAIMRDTTSYSKAHRVQGSYAAYMRARIPEEQRPLFDEVLEFERLYMTGADGDRHRRLRGIASLGFTPRRITELGVLAERYTDELLQGFVGEDVSDLATFAYQLPLLIIGDLLGVPHADHARIHEWIDALARNQHNVEAAPLIEAHAAMMALRAYIEAMIENHRRSPNVTDLIGAFMEAEEGDRLTTDEMTAMFILLLDGGHETTTNLIAIGLLELLRNRGQWETLCADTSLAPRAVEELLRWVSPAQFALRLPIVDVEISGVPVPAGQAVFVLTAGANRDPGTFQDPETLDITRDDSDKHLAFGFGPHFCIGNALARLEAQVVFNVLARRFPDVELASDSISFRGSSLLRTIVSLPVRLGEDHAR